MPIHTQTIYFSDHLHRDHPTIFRCLKEALTRHHYPVQILADTKDIWIRDFMPIVWKGQYIQYRYDPDYLRDPESAPYRTDPQNVIDTLKLNMKPKDVILDGGNVVKYGDTIIMTDKIYQENQTLPEHILTKEVFDGVKKLIVIPRDPDKDEVYGHADGMIRFITQEHLLVNSTYPDDFKQKLHHRLEESGFTLTELKLKEQTSLSWGYINFLYLDGLIIQPAIDKVNDRYVKEQLQLLYPDTELILCDAKALLKKGGGFNCVSWESF